MRDLDNSPVYSASGAARPRRREIWPVPTAAFSTANRIDDAALDELVEFYVESRVDGLFILAYSGEAFELSDAERVAVCQRVVERARGRLGVVAAGNFGGDLDTQIRQLNELADTGVDAAVIFVSTLPRASSLAEDLCTIADRVSTPLGVYECPAPEHRLLTTADVVTIAATGRFTFMKETSRNRVAYREKLAAAQGSPLKVMPANFGQLPGAIEDGCPGFCGIIACAFPELTDAYCNDTSLTPDARQTLHVMLSDLLGCMTRRHYPATLKYVLQRRGLEISDHSRMATGLAVDSEDRIRIDETLERLQLLAPTRSILERVGAGETVAVGKSQMHAGVVTARQTIDDSAEID